MNFLIGSLHNLRYLDKYSLSLKTFLRVTPSEPVLLAAFRIAWFWLWPENLKDALWERCKAFQSFFLFYFILVYLFKLASTNLGWMWNMCRMWRSWLSLLRRIICLFCFSWGLLWWQAEKVCPGFAVPSPGWTFPYWCLHQGFQLMSVPDTALPGTDQEASLGAFRPEDLLELLEEVPGFFLCVPALQELKRS